MRRHIFKRDGIAMPVRFAVPGDSRGALNIYAQYIRTPITFECALPTEQEFAERIAAISGYYPYLVCEEGGKIIGYAYAHRHMEREAYQWNAELSVYLDAAHTSRGLGKKLYGALIAMLKLQGIRTVYGCVTVPNKKSEALHKTLGFQISGTYHNAGYKNGKWHDVMWFEKAIAQYEPCPRPIVSIADVAREQLQKILSSAG